MGKSKQLKDISIFGASDYWDEHDFTEIEDVEEVTDIDFSLKNKKYIGVDVELYSRIKAEAKKMHTTEDLLINRWLKEKVG